MSKPADTIERRLVFWFGLVVVIVAVMVVFAVRSTRQAVASSDWVNHTHAVIIETDAILSSLNAAEAAQANFLVSGEPRDLATARNALGAVRDQLEVARALVGDNSNQQLRLSAIEQRVLSRISAAEALLKVRVEQGFEPARVARLNLTNTAPLAEIRRAISDMKESENRLLHERDRASRVTARATRWVVYAGLALNTLLLAGSFFLIRYDLQVRRRAAEALQTANDVLEAKVAERTKDLATANQALEIENLEQRWSQAALERLHRYDESILNSTTDGIFVVSSLGKIVRLNTAAARMTGYDANELLGERLSTFMQPEARPEPGADPIVAMIQREEPAAAQAASLRNKTGRAVLVRFGCQPVEDEDRVVAAVVTVTPEHGATA